jgi:hypothetical protein
MKKIFVTILFLVVCKVLMAQQGSGGFSLRGYIKEMPSLHVEEGFKDVTFNNLMHNRLNFRWQPTGNINVILEGRNRIFYNPLFADYPFYKDLLERDAGLLDLSSVWASEGAWMVHSIADRLFVDWTLGNWQLRAGRQRINWGINLVSNPNDLFNTYSFFDFDYPERPGADALRVQYYTGDLSRFEVVFNPAHNSRESVAAALLVFNRESFDFQFLAGYYRHRSAVGGGWAGNIGELGFKGEATYFYDIEATEGLSRGNLVAATGLDHIFSTGTYSVFEILYNGGHGRRLSPSLLFTEPLAADDIMFSEWAFTLSGQHPFTPVFSGNLALMVLPDVEAVFISPGLTRSLTTDFDFELTGQIFTGSRNSPFFGAGMAWFMALKYSF